MAAPNEDEMNEQINFTMESVEQGTTRWPGMTYEQGVDAALRWAMGESDEPPMED